MLHEGASEAARLLRADGIGLEAARAELLALAERGVVPAARPSDLALLGALGIDPEEIRRTSERAFGAQALGEATWRHRRITAHAGLPDGYQGAAGPLLAALGVDQEALRRADVAALREVGS
jgi:hypothetical protein